MTQNPNDVNPCPIVDPNPMELSNSLDELAYISPLLLRGSIMDENPKDVASMEPNWLKVVIGSKMSSDIGRKPKVVSSVIGREISLANLVINSISSKLSLSLIGNFFSF